ncbi:E2F-associated phosphoprotein-like protein [Leptotrombidium deliense]|uniref:E2F-associated phosphoprotein-like protein n=1 Tax=Leptotrombidium deliense TaxID=299467 RepID=A0A443SGX4_9ACAR|nr:E2F-associated phosphoprotein-like protein [Leptotrombidium deliense]
MDDLFEENFAFGDNDYSSSDEEDIEELLAETADFEKEMETERDVLFKGKRLAQCLRSQSASMPQSSSRNIDDEDDTSQESNSNDAILYDPKADGNDEKWVSSLRHTTITENMSKPADSDAVLNCPFCMSLLSLDCQRHEIYKTQYRAMFVFNCFVDFSQKMEFRGTKNRRKKHTVSSSPAETYHSVKCTVCGTQVAVYDKDDVYHFFNVLSSYS